MEGFYHILDCLSSRFEDYTLSFKKDGRVHLSTRPPFHEDEIYFNDIDALMSYFDIDFRSLDNE